MKDIILKELRKNWKEEDDILKAQEKSGEELMSTQFIMGKKEAIEEIEEFIKNLE